MLGGPVPQLGLVVVWNNGGKGIHFDVVGSGWAMFGLLFLIKVGKIAGPVKFWV